MYRNKLDSFRERFPNIKLKFRTGIETFNPALRNYLEKGVNPGVTAADVAKYFNGVCLLVGFRGQTRDDITRDIELASQNFEYFSVNVFTPNTTAVKPAPELISWFKSNIYPRLKDNPRAEVLLENTDLGVGAST